MSARLALVVDDSKSARVVLSRMLEKFGVAVDTADSAEAALEYLKVTRPDVIFMDHLMPGMDGLQAVKLIKGDPETATVPIMMYTSQEGELYVGQARALGAMGVLPKTVKPIDVTKVLYQLKLLPDRRDLSRSALQPVGESGELSAEGEHAGSATELERHGLTEALLKEQSVELRRFIVASLDSQANRLITELRPRETPDEPQESLPPPPPATSVPWGWVAAAALLFMLGVLGALYWQLLDSSRQVEVARAELETESAALRSSLDEVRAATVLPATAIPAAVPQARQLLLPVPYGEAPLAPVRLEALRSLVAELERENFRGVIRMENVAGEFCLAGDAEQGYSLADPAARVTQCDYRGNPLDESATGAARLPVAFANLAASVRRRSGGSVELAVVQGPPDHVIVAYPESGQATAGEWNRAAAVNNRLEVTVLPR